MPEVRNWSGTLITHPRRIVHPRTIDEVRDCLVDAENYPAPVRVLGSYHSTTACAVADAGTLIRLDNMTRILEVGDDFVRVEAGALYLDVARQLAAHGREFFVNLEIGNITMGSAACCATKDGAFPDEFGQASSYCIALTLVTPAGDVVTIDASDPNLLRAARSSYGLFGVVCEVTFRVRPIQPIAVEHRNYSVEGFIRALPALSRGDASVAFYIFPFLDGITVQLRRPTDAAGRANRVVWWLRNFGVAHVVPVTGRCLRLLPWPKLRDMLAAGFYQLARQLLRWLIRSRKTIASDQTTRYAHRPRLSRFAFSLWGFPADAYPQILRDYVSFVREHYRRTGYRSYLLTVGYRVSADDEALLSYSAGTDVLTIDPVSGGEDGWDDFIDAFNAFCVERGGRPLLNQTPRLSAAQMRAAFGDRLDEFAARRRHYDPDGRMLSPYWAGLFGIGAEGA
jgi:FAD/FMN-containing dehydrogenase